MRKSYKAVMSALRTCIILEVVRVSNSNSTAYSGLQDMVEEIRDRTTDIFE